MAKPEALIFRRHGQLRGLPHRPLSLKGRKEGGLYCLNGRGCLKSRSVIADLFRDPELVVLNEIPAQGRNDIQVLI